MKGVWISLAFPALLLVVTVVEEVAVVELLLLWVGWLPVRKRRQRYRSLVQRSLELLRASAVYQQVKVWVQCPRHVPWRWKLFKL